MGEGLETRGADGLSGSRRVEEGERLVLTRGGREIAQVHTASEPTTAASLPTLKEWRASIDVGGERMSKTVQRQREEERY